MTSNTQVDAQVENHGSLFLFHLRTDAAREFVAEHVSEDAQYFDHALAVEPRYAQDLAQGMINEGLEVR